MLLKSLNKWNNHISLNVGCLINVIRIEEYLNDGICLFSIKISNILIRNDSNNVIELISKYVEFLKHSKFFGQCPCICKPSICDRDAIEKT